MGFKKTLGIIALIGTIGLCGCGIRNEESDKSVSNTTNKRGFFQTIPKQHKTKKISGEIIDIDEDSFAVHTGSDWGGGCNFEFENIRIKSDDGKIYKLIYAGPSSYRIGDKVQNLNFEKLLNGKISYYNLTRPTWHSDTWGSNYTVQVGSIEADGIIIF